MFPTKVVLRFIKEVQEAFAFGPPAAVSNLGPFPSNVRYGESGVVFESDDTDILKPCAPHGNGANLLALI